MLFLRRTFLDRVMNKLYLNYNSLHGRAGTKIFSSNISHFTLNMFCVIPCQSVYWSLSRLVAMFRMRNDGIPRYSVVPHVPRSKNFAICTEFQNLMNNIIPGKPEINKSDVFTRKS